MAKEIRDLFFGNWSLPRGDVWELQNGLRELGYADFSCTGFYGYRTQEAVSRFQSDYAITPSYGYFGPKTRPVFEEKLLSSRMNRNTIYQIAVAYLGTDVTPEDIVPDEYDCADTVCVLLKKAGFGIGNFPLTTDMFKVLSRSPKWFRAYSPLAGDIIISPTGWGNGAISNGHVGIMGIDGKIMSNTSSTGIFRENYTLISWNKRYKDLGGFPVVFFRSR